MKNMHEWGSLAFKHIEVPHRNGKLTPRAKQMRLVGYNTKNMTYRLWDPKHPHEISNSGKISFREKSARDVGRPKAGYDPFPDPSTVFVPRVETDIEAEETQQQESSEPPIMSPEQLTILRKSNWQQGISPDSASAQQWSLITNVDKIAHASYKQAEYALITGEDVGSIAAGKPGEIGYIPPEPRNNDDAVSGVDAEGWRASMTDERTSLIEHDVFEWVDPPKAFKRSRQGFCTGRSTTRTEYLVDSSREWWCKGSTRLTLGLTRQHQ